MPETLGHLGPVGTPHKPDRNVRAAGDIYTAPSESGPGTGYTTADIGTVLTLKPGNPHQAISPSDFFEIEDASDYEESITGCRITKAIGDTYWHSLVIASAPRTTVSMR